MKEKSTAVLFLILLFASRVGAQYVTATIADCPNDGKGGVCIVYTGQNVKPTDPGDSRFQARTALELAQLSAQRKAQLNGLDTTKKAFAPGTVVQDPAPDTPAADDVAVTAFALLVQTWQAMIVKERLGLASAGEVTTAAAAVASSYSKGTASQQPRFDILLVVFAGRPQP